MNPITIPIGTSNPVNLCYGLPLFSTGAARAGIMSSSRSESLLDVSATIFVTRLKASAYSRYAFGACGPAVAFLFDNVQAARSNPAEKGELTLTLASGQQLEAGAFLGLSVGAGVSLAFQLYRPTTWYAPWRLAWSDAFTASLDVNVDFLALLVELISYLLSRGSKNSFSRDTQNTLSDALLGQVGTYILSDTAGGMNVEPELRAVPELVLPINLVNYIPLLRQLNSGLSKIGGEISVGPSLHLRFPVTFSLQSFKVEGGLQGASSATYGSLRYNSNQIIATGDVQFDEQADPARITTNVKYSTAFTLALSFHFRITVAKLFNFEVNSPSLDLSNLLYNTPESQRSVHQVGSVTTSVQGGCLLTPDITLDLVRSSGSTGNLQTGETVKGTVVLSSNFQGSTPGIITINIEPPVDGFPSMTTIQPGNQYSFPFYFAFSNQCLLTGDPARPSATAPPSPTSPVQTYSIRATLALQSGDPCSDYEVTVPLNVTNRFLRLQRNFAVVGPSPPWDPLAGAQINANSALSPTNTLDFIGLSCWFPYVQGESPSSIPIKFTLLDENRMPHVGSQVVIAAPALSGNSVTLSPSATLNVTPGAGNVPLSPTLSVQWKSKGPHNEYANRFFLIADGGCEFGQTEFWLDAWNWS